VSVKGSSLCVCVRVCNIYYSSSINPPLSYICVCIQSVGAFHAATCYLLLAQIRGNANCFHALVYRGALNVIRDCMAASRLSSGDSTRILRLLKRQQQRQGVEGEARDEEEETPPPFAWVLALSNREQVCCGLFGTAVQGFPTAAMYAKSDSGTLVHVVDTLMDVLQASAGASDPSADRCV
jgi:hypothetical protein